MKKGVTKFDVHLFSSTQLVDIELKEKKTSSPISSWLSERGLSSHTPGETATNSRLLLSLDVCPFFVVIVLTTHPKNLR